MKAKKHGRSQEVLNDLQNLRDELHHMARRAAAADVDDLKEKLEERHESPRSLVVSTPPAIQLSGGNSAFMRGVIGAVALLGLTLGGNYTVRTLADTGENPTVAVQTFKTDTYLQPEPSVVLDKRYFVERPIIEIHMEDEPYTFRRPVEEVTYRDKTVKVNRPKTEVVMVSEKVKVRRWKTVPVYSNGCWVNTRRLVDTYVTRKVPRKRTRMVAVEEVRKVPVKTIRYVEEQRTRKVPVQRVRYVQEERTRSIPESPASERVALKATRYGGTRTIDSTPRPSTFASMPAPAL